MKPILFTLPGGYPVYAFGVMLGLSLVVGFQLTVRLAQRDHIDRDTSGNACLAAVLAGLFGARILYVTLNAQFLEDTPAPWWNIQAGGLMGVGGLLAGFAAAALYLRIKGASVMALSDAAAPAMAMGVTLTRIGSYLYGSDFGTRLGEGAPGWLAKLGTFPKWTDSQLVGSPPFTHHMNAFGLLNSAEASYPVHPVQLYEALLGLALFALALHWRRHRAFVGQVFLRTMLLYAVGAFLLSYLRDDPDRAVYFDFTATQLFALLTVPALLIARGPLQRATEDPTTAQDTPGASERSQA